MAGSSRQVKSKQRVTDHGEVFTHEREVNAMLDLVKQETERIDSRFLEPACGTGNFLVEILRRKLAVVARRYGKVQLEYERYAFLAVSSIYGIDILADNVNECRLRLTIILQKEHNRLFLNGRHEQFLKAASYVLCQNIIHGDALTYRKVGVDQPIIFAEWSPIGGNLIKRRDYAMRALLPAPKPSQPNLFSEADAQVFIPEPVKEYPPTHFLKLAQHDHGKL